jgi:asparagine synthase (glutamine-hydrolysing)
MKGICGWFSNGRIGDGEETLRRMLAAHRGPATDPESKSLPQAGLSIFGGVARPALLETDGYVLAIAGHPRLRGADRATGDLAAIARRLRDDGREALPAIGGDFALAAWDSRRSRGLLAVDRIGVHRLVYADAARSLAFGSTLDMLFGHPDVRRRLCAQGIFDYLHHHVCPGPGTIYEGPRRLLPGHSVEFDSRGAGEPSAYWTMRFAEERGPSLEDRKREFVELLRSSVDEASDAPACGAFLSGGTDSSTVSGTLGSVRAPPARTFSIGFDVPGFDETEYARIAARHFGTEHHEYYVTPSDVVESLPKIADSFDQPFGNASAVPTYHCARFAHDHGVVRLLAGDGGDELFGGNERYAKQHLLSLYHGVPAPLRRFIVEPLLFSTPGVGALPLLRKLRSYVEQARPPMPLRYESYNLLQHFGVAKVFTPEFLRSIDASHPLELLADAYAPFAEASLVNQMLAIDLRFILGDGDLPKVSQMCNLAEVDVTFPLLDDRIIDFSSRLPRDLKLRGTQLRWFFKQALSDFLPAEIIVKKKHGFGLPVGHWLLAHRPLFEMASDSIGSLRPHGIVRPEFVRHLLDVKLREHPGYYGVMVWVLMMLGLWLDSRGF